MALISQRPDCVNLTVKGVELSTEQTLLELGRIEYETGKPELAVATGA